MCAIAGIININSNLTKDEMIYIVNTMASKMSHRGPDDSGVWIDPEGRCALSHRRLIVIDKSKDGHQPMESLDKNYSLTYNGEIYNYRELREELISQNCRFRTNTDTEVLLNALIHYGHSAYEKIDGMYGFGLYNIKNRELILGRDPFGEKPLYYTYQNGFFSFASEIQALKVLPNFNDHIDDESISQYLLLQYIHSPNTVYKSVKKLEPGHYLKLLSNGTVKIIKHFTFNPNVVYFENRPIDELLDELESLLVNSIKRRLISDVPLGAFLSGGVDSSLVVAIVTKVLNEKIETFSIGFSSAKDSEHLYSSQISELLNTSHNVKILPPEIVQNVDMIAKILDEPNGDNSCLPTYLLSNFAREKITVSISGDGSDELFGGYQRYIDTLEMENLYQDRMSYNSLRADKFYFNNTGIFIFDESEVENLLGRIPDNTKSVIMNFKQRVSNINNNTINKMRKLDITSYLPGAVLAKVDRMSMQNSIEVRTPYLSRDIASFCEKLKPEHCYFNGQGKYILKKLASRYLPVDWMTRKKIGFNFPLDYWAKTQLTNHIRDIILDSDSIFYNWIDRNSMIKYFDNQISKDDYNSVKIWSLLILELWLRYNIKKGS